MTDQASQQTEGQAPEKAEGQAPETDAAYLASIRAEAAKARKEKEALRAEFEAFKASITEAKALEEGKLKDLYAAEKAEAARLKAELEQLENKRRQDFANWEIRSRLIEHLPVKQVSRLRLPVADIEVVPSGEGYAIGDQTKLQKIVDEIVADFEELRRPTPTVIGERQTVSKPPKQRATIDNLKDVLAAAIQKDLG